MSTHNQVHKSESEPESNTWVGVIMELTITVTDVTHSGYCSDAGDETEEKTTTTIRVPIWKLSPKTQGKFDENTSKYTGKYGRELYTDLMAIKLLQQHEEILHTAMYNNYAGTSWFETGCNVGSGYCGCTGSVCIEYILTY